MQILSIDTCSVTATAAVVSDDRLVAEVVQNNGKTHSRNIMPMIECMLSQADISPDDIDCFAAAVGPGSFTGVRIGVATVKALAHATGKPCVAVSALEGLAYNVFPFNGIVCPIMDARRGQVYNALFDGRNMSRITEDRVVSMEELLEELKGKTDAVIFTGDGVSVFENMIKEALGENAVISPRMQRLHLAASVAEIGERKFLDGDTMTYDELKPLYLRLSQAERERMERLKQAGGNEQ